MGYGVYDEQIVAVPDEKSKIMFRKYSDSTVYVLFETDRVYLPEKQYTHPKRRMIGMLVDPSDRTRMYPNKSYYKLFPHVPPLELPEPKQSDTLKVGANIAINKIFVESGVDKILKMIFGPKSALIEDLVSYQIINGSNVYQHFDKYAFNHPLRSKGKFGCSDSAISRFLREITPDQIKAFTEAWNADRDHNQCIFISYDSTNKNIDAGDVNLGAYGHPKVDIGSPVLNVAVGFDQTNRDPLFLYSYRGDLPDVREMPNAVNLAYDLGYRNIGFILDRGYFSYANIDLLDERTFHFLIMVKGCKALVSALVDEKRNTFEFDSSKLVTGTQLYAITVKRKLYLEDSKERYFHLCFSPEKQAAEHRELLNSLAEMEAEMRKHEGKEYVVPESYTTYFNCVYRNDDDKQIFEFAVRKHDVITTELKRCGYFCLISSNRMTAEDAYLLYSGRDSTEKLFRADKSFLGADRMRVHCDDAVKTKIFLEFICLIVRNRLFNLLKDEMLRTNTRHNFMTVQAAIKLMEVIEITRYRPNGSYRQSTALSKSHKIVYRGLGLSEDDIRANIIQLAKGMDAPDATAKGMDAPDATAKGMDAPDATAKGGHGCA